jgi:hypothetical protein
MYGDDAADEESHVAAMAVVAAGTTAWLLVDGDETEVEDDDNDEEAEAVAEAHRDAQLHAVEVRIKVAAEAQRVAATEAGRVADDEAEEREAAEQAVHWAAEMDKALAYRWDVARREATRRAETEHRMTVRRQEVAGKRQ